MVYLGHEHDIYLTGKQINNHPIPFPTPQSPAKFFAVIICLHVTNGGNKNANRIIELPQNSKKRNGLVTELHFSLMKILLVVTLKIVYPCEQSVFGFPKILEPEKRCLAFL